MLACVAVKWLPLMVTAVPPSVLPCTGDTEAISKRGGGVIRWLSLNEGGVIKWLNEGRCAGAMSSC